MILAYVYGIGAGLALGISIALFVTVRMVKKSNDIGDSQGQFHDFGDYIDVYNHEDELRQVY